MNSFGRIFRVSIFGESHGPQIGVVLDGVEPGIEICEDDFSADIARRKSGAKGTTPRIETDKPHIVSGVFEGHTTGAPLTVIFNNENVHSADYHEFSDIPRPGQADFAASVKYMENNDLRGGGHFSGRLTLPIVAAGVVAKKVISEVVTDETDGKVSFRDNATLIEVGGVSDPEKWPQLLDAATKEGDSLGGIVECVVDGLPAGLGEPFFDSVESLISHAVFSIPGVRGIEFGDGFKASRMKGSEHNDPFTGFAQTSRNGAGGINGGILNGNPIVFRVAFKPTSSIHKAQHTFDFETNEMTDFQIPGRHDVCFALRTPVIVEAMAAIVIADLIDIA